MDLLVYGMWVGLHFLLDVPLMGGMFPGPRIYPSGAFISQTSGHGDLRHYNDPNPTLTGIVSSNRERMGYTIVVDGRARVLAAVRQNLMQGATQIKIMGGGGGASKYDPIDVTPVY